MKKLINLIAGPVAAALLCVASGSPSYASTTLFVSGGGSDANPCTLAQPCRTIGFALGQAGYGGTVSCLDAGPYTESFVSGRPFTLDCRGVVYPSGGGFAVSIASSGPRVTIRNVIFDGAIGGGGAVQITGGRVVFENCTFQNFTASPGQAVDFAPTFAGAQLTITDSLFSNNGLGTSGGGIIIQPSGSDSAYAVIERTTVENNTYGIFANNTGSTGTILLHIKDSTVANSAFNGISAYTAGSTTAIVIDHSSSLINGGSGILSQGSGGLVFLTDTTVMSNVTGLSATGGGTIYSYGNNRLTGNVGDGVTPVTGGFALK
jgi:Right handed beta helix region